MNRGKKIQIESLHKEINKLEKDYQEVEDKRRAESNPQEQNNLQLKLDRIVKHIDEKEHKIKELKQQLLHDLVTSNPSQSTELPTFKFEVVTIRENNQGEWVCSRETTPRQNQYFTQNLGNAIELEMVKIPHGTFMMGAPTMEEDRSYERPQHQVTVPSFFMGKYPITQAQWRTLAKMVHLQANRSLNPDPSHFKGDNLPVDRVSWYDAIEFCARLSQYTGKQYRLPSEAEWEYAARAGTTTPFHFGETITTDLANYNGNHAYASSSKRIYRKQTTDVGSFPPNGFGLYDIHGNVWEWCLDDLHENYEGAPKDGSPWFDNNDNLSQKLGVAVLRGGSWISSPNYCRSACRSYYVRTALAYFNVGFRVVRAFGRKN